MEKLSALPIVFGRVESFYFGMDLGKSGFNLGLSLRGFTLRALTLQAAVFRSLS